MKTNIKFLNILFHHSLPAPSTYLPKIILPFLSGKFYDGPEISLLFQSE